MVARTVDVLKKEIDKRFADVKTELAALIRTDALTVDEAFEWLTIFIKNQEPLIEEWLEWKQLF